MRISYVVVLVLLLSLLYTRKRDNARFYEMNEQITKLKSERPDLWHESCIRAVDRSCYYADCAVTPIETMRDQICKPMEEE